MDAQKIITTLGTDEQALQFVEEITRDISCVQDQALQTILEADQGTEYFERHGLYGQASKAEFRKLMPMITYDDIESDIQRIANGDESRTICAHPVREMLTREAPETTKGKSLQFIYVRKPGITSGGVITCSGLSGYFTSPAFRNRKLDPNTGFTSPDEVIACVDYQQASYCHLLCGLMQSKQVVTVGAVFASTLVRSLKTLQECWRELCDDIQAGKVSSDIVSDFAVKDAVNRLLRPDPKLAAAIRRECGKSNWRGIIRRLWPNAKLVQAIVTGSMQQYVPIIDFFTDSLPIASSLYASSECSTLGVNLNPVCSPARVAYTIFPCFGYYEFLPVSRSGGSSSQDLVELADVELGKEYELVITTKAGLHRYRVGDVLKVVSFHNNAPQFSFVRRAGVLLSVDTDKTDELELHSAVTRAASVILQKQRDVQLVDYTSRVDLSAQPGHYVIYWELSVDCIDAGSELKSDLQECCTVIEDSLSVVYLRNRREGVVGALEIKLVKPGTFDRVVDHVVFEGHGSIGQYKTPRCARNPALVRILESGVCIQVRAGER